MDQSRSSSVIFSLPGTCAAAAPSRPLLGATEQQGDSIRACSLARQATWGSATRRGRSRARPDKPRLRRGVPNSFATSVAARCLRSLGCACSARSSTSTSTSGPGVRPERSMRHGCSRPSSRWSVRSPPVRSHSLRGPGRPRSSRSTSCSISSARWRPRRGFSASLRRSRPPIHLDGPECEPALQVSARRPASPTVRLAHSHVADERFFRAQPAFPSRFGFGLRTSRPPQGVFSCWPHPQGVSSMRYIRSLCLLPSWGEVSEQPS